MNKLSDFQKEKQALLSFYDSIGKSELLPVDAISREAFETKKQSLIDEVFVVAACGQMKAGKSTLLNALVFAESVLPLNATVTTAKITLIEYRDAPGYEVRFYSQNEWDALDEDLRDHEKLYSEFNAKVDVALRSGISFNNYVQKNGKTLQVDGYDDLNIYVDTEGLLSPFVKDAVVYHTNELFKEVQIVDTPGINDPNKQRDRVTKDWIHNASAVVYVAYSKHLMDREDVDFIDKFVVGVPTPRRVLAINKIDDAHSSMDDIKNYVQRLRSNDDSVIRQAVAPETHTSYVCSLGGLIERAQKKGITLEENILEHQDIWDADGIDWTVPGKHGLDDLQQKIESRLISNKGAGLINEHRAFLLGIHTRNINNREEMIADIEAQISRLHLDDSDIAKLIKKTNSGKKTLDSFKEELDDEFNNISNNHFAELKSALSRVRMKITKEFKLQIDGLRKANQIKQQARTILIDVYDAHYEELHNLLRKEALNISELLGDVWKRREIEILEMNILAQRQLRSIFKIRTYDVLGKMENSLSEISSEDNLANEISKINWFVRAVRWEEEAKQAADLAYKAVAEGTIVSFRNLLEKFKNAAHETQERASSDIQEHLADAFDKMEGELTDLQEKKTDVQARSQVLMDESTKINGAIENIRQRLDAFESVTNEVQ